VSRDIPLLARSLVLLVVSSWSFHYAVDIALCYASASLDLLGKRVGRTHGLLVQPIQTQSRRRRRLLRPGTNLVDCVERMAKDSVCSYQHISPWSSTGRSGLLPASSGMHVPTESDITTRQLRAPTGGSLAPTLQ
jgi:hypothetical protein